MKQTIAIASLLLALCGCTPRDKAQTREDLRKTGTAVKKEFKNDAAFMKQQALKAREETQKGVKELKKDVDDHKSNQ